MSGVDLVAYVASLLVVGTYALMATGRARPVVFDWANGVGCVPIIASEVVVGAWPALILTASFGVVGWVGVMRHRAEVRRG